MIVLPDSLYQGSSSKIYKEEALSNLYHEQRFAKIFAVVACCLLLLGMGLLAAGIYFMSGIPLVTTAFIVGFGLVSLSAILVFLAVIFLKKEV